MRFVSILDLPLHELLNLKKDYELKLEETKKNLDYYERNGLTWRDKYDSLVDDEFDLFTEIKEIEKEILKHKNI